MLVGDAGQLVQLGDGSAVGVMRFGVREIQADGSEQLREFVYPAQFQGAYVFIGQQIVIILQLSPLTLVFYNKVVFRHTGL